MLKLKTFITAYPKSFSLSPFFSPQKRRKEIICGSEGKASACNVGDSGSIPELGRSPGEGNGNPLQYPCLENPMDGEAGRLKLMGSQRVGHD